LISAFSPFQQLFLELKKSCETTFSKHERDVVYKLILVIKEAIYRSNFIGPISLIADLHVVVIRQLPEFLSFFIYYLIPSGV